MSFTYYQNQHKGKLSESEFNELLPIAYDTLQIVVGSLLPSWNVAYVDLKQERYLKSICYQVDFLSTQGGMNALIDGSYSSIKTIDTAGFTLKYDGSQATVNGIPVSPIVKMFLEKELKLQGLMYRGIA